MKHTGRQKQRSVPPVVEGWIKSARAAGVRVKLNANATDEDRARWLLDFAVLDLTSLSEGNWVDVRQALGRLVTPGLKSRGSAPPARSAEKVRALQDWLLKGLVAIYAERTWCEVGRIRSVLQSSDNRLNALTEPSGSAGTAEGFRFGAHQVLARAASRFRLCGWCGRPFIAKRKQGYCVPQCSQAGRTRRFREKQKYRRPAVGGASGFRTSGSHWIKVTPGGEGR